MSNDKQIDLASVALHIEEFVAAGNGLAADVMPASQLGMEDADVKTYVARPKSAKVIVSTDHSPDGDALKLLESLSQLIGAEFKEEPVNFAEVSDPAAVVVVRGDAALAVVFVSEIQKQEAKPQGLLNIGVLRHVPLDVTAELGRARLTMEEILQCVPGSVIELDRAAGSPVDVVVNGSAIARGEVVVLGEEYGIRITEIVQNQM